MANFMEKMDTRMEAKGSRAKAIWQFIKFNIVSFTASLIQIALSYLLLALLKNWKATLPYPLTLVFTEQTVGEGNVNWGYVLPFLVSNLTANIYAYLLNRKTTFKSDAPKRNLVIYIVILLCLILFSTWLQGVIVHAIRASQVSFWLSLNGLAPTIASICASFLQFLILFPLQKYVLLKEKKAPSTEEHKE